MTFVLFLLKKLVYYYQPKVLPDACLFHVNEATLQNLYTIGVKLSSSFSLLDQVFPGLG